jgi:hypothetical protein
VSWNKSRVTCKLPLPKLTEHNPTISLDLNNCKNNIRESLAVNTIGVDL